MPATPNLRETGDEIRIGVSACLLGEEVRFDGGHKRDDFLTGTLGNFVRYVTVCPEVEVGMGIPRETIRLERHGEQMRLVAIRSGKDWTEPMTRYASQKARALAEQELCGFILKTGSPSCGMERVKVHAKVGRPARSGAGLFAAALMRTSPLLPVEEEGRLHDPRLRENFLERVFAYRRLRRLFSRRYRIGELVEFHSREKLLLLAHDRPTHSELGRLVARAKTISRDELAREYPSAFLDAMKRLATTRKHHDVLRHISGHFKKILPAGDEDELRGAMADYKRGLVPLIMPLTLIRPKGLLHLRYRVTAR